MNQLTAAEEAAREPESPAAVERILRQAWDAKPSDELDAFDAEPAAVTPTAQVHRGVLEGRPVAIKLVRRGLAGAVRQDLALLDALVRPVGAAFPGFDAAALLAELRARTVEELDLEHEAVMQRRFHRALRDHPALVVPEPVMRLSHEGVLVSEWIDGVPIGVAPQRDRNAARLVGFVLGSARHGVIHADPDPDDLLVTADGRLAVLDYGATRTVPGDRVDRYLAALSAFGSRDGAGFAAAVGELGWLPATEGGAALEFVLRVLGDLAQAGRRRLDSSAVLAARDRLVAERPDIVAGLLAKAALPPEDLMVGRAVAQMFGVIARVGATGDWQELAGAALRDGWPSIS